MKKITILFVYTLSVFFTTNIYAQSFEKGSINFDLGIGIGAYGTKQSLTTTISSVSITKDTTDGAASTIIPISFEYGLGKKIGLGADLTINNYFINDSDRKLSILDHDLIITYLVEIEINLF